MAEQQNQKQVEAELNHVLKARREKLAQLQAEGNPFRLQNMM